MPDTLGHLIKDLADRLGAMADEFGARAERMEPHADGAEPDPGELTRRARQLLADRKARRSAFPAELFHEPAWDMLVGLFLVRDAPRPLTVKTLATYADAPVTTSQRWIEHLARLGLVTRTADPADRRRVEVTLSELGLARMQRYLSLLPAPIPRDLAGADSAGGGS